MRALVIGASGQVGGALCAQLGAAHAVGIGRASTGASSPGLDLERLCDDPEPARRWLARERFDAVFIAAAMTWVDGCEESPALAQRTNAEGPRVLAVVARAAGAKTVLFSTEYVFDGHSGPYAEDSAPHPLSVYGASKLAGERAVLEADPSALVLRTTVVYGPEVQGKNFAYRLAAELCAGRRVRVPADQITTPTYGPDLAGAAVALAARGASGIVHVVGPETMDRAEHARRLARAAGLDPSGIEPVSTASLGQRASRPLRAGLRCERLRTLLTDVTLRTVEEAVADWRAHPRGRPWPAAAC
jgi:dTDP-4-dehydrorhamnose reductase